MKDINFSDTVQFGIWKYLDEVNGVVVPQYSCAQPITNGVRLGNGNDTIAGVGDCGVMPKRYFEGISIDLDGPDVNFSVSGSDIGSIKVIIFTPEPLEAVHLGYIEGFYTISSVNGFDNVTGDVHFKSSLNQSIVPSPTIDSVTRAPNNIVTILGTAKPFSVVTLIPDDNDDEPIAYSKVLEGASNFSFILELPVAFSGYIRCRDGNIGSEGTTVNI